MILLYSSSVLGRCLWSLWGVLRIVTPRTKVTANAAWPKSRVDQWVCQHLVEDLLRVEILANLRPPVRR